MEHAFKDIDGKTLRPVLAVLSYSVIDLMAFTVSAEFIKENADRIAPDFLEQRPDLRYPHVLGICLQIAMQEATAPKEIELSIEKQRTCRPLHYRTNDNQVARWVNADAPNGELVATPYAVLFEPVPDNTEFQLHDTADAAVQAHLDEGHSLPDTGHHKYYRPTFGGNEQYMYRHIDFLKAMTQQQFTRFEQAHRKFTQAQRENFENTIKQRVLNHPEVKKYGFVMLKTQQGKPVAEVPRLPLMCWALSQARVTHEQIGYEPISPRHFKLPNDNPYHTDWMMAAGLTKREDYRSNSDVQEAANWWAADFQVNNLGLENHVLSKGKGDVVGVVRHATEDNAVDIQPGDIVILPNASPRYQMHMEIACQKGGAVITEIGGKGVHLVTVSNERGFTMLRIDNARKHYPEGAQLLIQPEKGAVSLLEEDSTKT